VSRGYRNIKRYVPFVHEEEKESFWVSYTDLMSGLLIILALVLMVTMFDNQHEYEKQKEALDQSAVAIMEKEKEISETNALLEKNNKLIEEVLGIKSAIIRELVQAFKDSDLNLEVDPQTGAIRFSGGVFFDVNSSTVSSQGRDYLARFIPQYIDILLSERFRNEVAQIIVEGHTDTDGGYVFNLKLSQDRALSVVQQVLSPDFPKFTQQEVLQRVITANGRSFSEPVYKSNGTIDADKSRRVEFKFRLKDDQLLDQLQELMKANGK
jgi:outer membrane protein OmpA-like peptidoglycan-associated protein